MPYLKYISEQGEAIYCPKTTHQALVYFKFCEADKHAGILCNIYFLGQFFFQLKILFFEIRPLLLAFSQIKSDFGLLGHTAWIIDIIIFYKMLDSEICECVRNGHLVKVSYHVGLILRNKNGLLKIVRRYLERNYCSRNLCVT